MPLIAPKGLLIDFPPPESGLDVSCFLLSGVTVGCWLGRLGAGTVAVDVGHDTLVVGVQAIHRGGVIRSDIPSGRRSRYPPRWGWW